MATYATSPAHLVSILRGAGEHAWHLVKAADGRWCLRSWALGDVPLEERTAAFVRRVWGRGRRTGPKGSLATSALLDRLLTRAAEPVPEQYTFGQHVQHEGASYIVVGIVKGRARRAGGYVRVIATGDGGEARGGVCDCQSPTLVRGAELVTEATFFVCSACRLEVRSVHGRPAPLGRVS